jgi:predicted nucleic acid-binding protein
MRFYLDASALVAIMAEEPASDAVSDQLGRSDHLPVVTDFSHAESSAALSKLVRMRIVGAERVDDLLAQLDYWTSRFSERPEIAPADVADAALHVRHHGLGLRAPDAIHIAAAHRLGATLLTLDRGMARAAAALGVPCLNPAEVEAPGEPKD